MTHYNQLRTLLCEVEEIKKDLEELRFWTKIINTHTWTECIFLEKVDDWALVFNWIWNRVVLDRNIKIIWNDIEERHIRMYFNNLIWKEDIKYIPYKQKWFTIRYIIYDNEIRKYIEESWEYEKYITICELNNSKPFHQQDEEVYRQLVEYFLNLK